MKHHHFHHSDVPGRQAAEEALEKIWLAFEEKERELNPAVPLEKDLLSDEEIEMLKEEGWVEEKEGKLLLTRSGYERAYTLVRSHRLAERLLLDVLNFGDEQVEKRACDYEHLLDSDALESVCILLGHPRTCPHGRPIPRGRCCEEELVNIRPLVVPLSKLEAGEVAEVQYIGTRDSDRLTQLTSLGFMPGRKIQVLRTRPSFLVRLGESEIALDEEVAADIFVKPQRRWERPRRRRRRFFGRWGR